MSDWKPNCYKIPNCKVNLKSVSNHWNCLNVTHKSIAHPTVWQRRHVITSNDLKLVQLKRQPAGNYGYNLGYVQGNQSFSTRIGQGKHFVLISDAPQITSQRRTKTQHGEQGCNAIFEGENVSWLSTSQVKSGDDFPVNDRGLVEADRHSQDAVIVHSTVAPILTISRKPFRYHGDEPARGK